MRRAELRAAIYRALRDERYPELIMQMILSRWHTGFIQKSAGGPDEFGNEWEPLPESTKSQKSRRTSGGFRDVDRASHWVARRRSLVAQLWAGGMTMPQAQAKADSLMWQQTDIPIGIDTTRLEQSISPEGSEDQVRVVTPNRLTVQSTVPYGKYFNAKRRFQPTAEEAATWVRDAAVILRDSVAERVKRQA